MPKTAHSPKKNTNQNVNLQQHGSETDLTTVDLGSLDREALLNITKRLKRKAAEAPRSSNYFESKIDDLHASQESRFDILSNALTTLIDQNRDIKSSLESMSTKYDSLLSKVEILDKENHHYRTKIHSLEAQLESLERQARSTSVVIRNIPKSDQESKQDLKTTVNKIISVVGSSSPVEDLEIRDIYRNKSSAIVVDFTTTGRKSNLISKLIAYNKSKRSEKKSQLNSVDLNLPGPPKPVYISDYLTSKTGNLYYLAREKVKSKKLVAAWTSHGKVLVRTEVSDTPLLINNQEELENLVL